MDKPTGNICPRCGINSVNDVVLDPLSRHRFVNICRACGYDEAMRDMRGDPLPFTEWHDVKEHLATGHLVYEVIAAKTASVLVMAASEEEAMRLAARMSDEDFRQHTDWMCTDCIVLDDADNRPS